MRNHSEIAEFLWKIADLINFCGGEEKGVGPIYETLLRKRLLKVATSPGHEHR